MRGCRAVSCCGGWRWWGKIRRALDAILITHEHIDHVAGLGVLARRLNIPVFFTESTHRAWVRMMTPRTTMTYAKWLDHIQQEKAARAAAVAASAPASELARQLADESGVITQIAAEAGAHGMIRQQS